MFASTEKLFYDVIHMSTMFKENPTYKRIRMIGFFFKCNEIER